MEGEPASGKDKTLLARAPHLVLDGTACAAELIGASQAMIVVHHTARDIVGRAAAERRRAGCDPVPIRVITAADRFTAGEASAVVHWVQRGVPTPTGQPPRLGGAGRNGRPWLVQNVETLAQLALIIRHGASWFRSAGSPAEPGSMLVTLLGAVRRGTARYGRRLPRILTAAPGGDGWRGIRWLPVVGSLTAGLLLALLAVRLPGPWDARFTFH